MLQGILSKKREITELMVEKKCRVQKKRFLENFLRFGHISRKKYGFRFRIRARDHLGRDFCALQFLDPGTSRFKILSAFMRRAIFFP